VLQHTSCTREIQQQQQQQQQAKYKRQWKHHACSWLAVEIKKHTGSATLGTSAAVLPHICCQIGVYKHMLWCTILQQASTASAKVPQSPTESQRSTAGVYLLQESIYYSSIDHSEVQQSI
jgi:protein involved in temperature-dependent protein secretion